MPMAAIALQETSPPVDWGLPREVKQIASWDVSRQVAAQVNAAGSEINLTKIEREFLEILQEQAESNGIPDDGAQESEWYLFLKNLSPLTPTECDDEEIGPQKDGERICGDPSLGERGSLLDNLSQLETTVVQQILGHIESDGLQGLVQLHLRMIQDNPERNPFQESIALSNKEVPLNNPSNDLVRIEPQTTQSIPELDSNAQSVPKQFPIVEKSGTTERLQGSKPQPTSYFRTDNGGKSNWAPPGYSSYLAESKLEGILQVFQPQLTPRRLLTMLSPISERNMNLEAKPDSQVSAFQGFNREQQNLLPKSSSRADSDQEEVYMKHPQCMESEPEPFLDKLHTGHSLTNSDSCRTCSQQIESKLAEIPSQIASTLFMRNPLIMDSNLLHQLFRQIGQILFQVMHKQILFNSVHPKQTKAHGQWHVPPDCSFRKHLDEGVEYSKMNQLEVLNPQHWHQFKSTTVQKILQPTPQVNEVTSGLGRTELDQMRWQGNQSLNWQEVDSNIQLCQNSPCLWSAVFEYSAGVPNHLQLVPELTLDSNVDENLRCSKLDAMSFTSSSGGGGTWNPQMTLTKPPSTTHQFPLDKLHPAEMIDDLSLPPADPDQIISQPFPITDELVSEICQDMDSSYQTSMGLVPQENRQIQERMPSQAETCFEHLLPQKCIESPFQQIDPVELHALRQNMCLTVLQQIAKQVEYNISRGVPLEINAGLLEALDLQPEDYWLQPSGQETEPNHDFFQPHLDELWDAQEVDVDSEACPETSQHTEYFKELSVDKMRQTVESSTSGWTTEPSEPDSPPYYMADRAKKVYHRHYRYKDGNVDNLGLPISQGKFFDEFEEFLHFEEFHGSALESGMPLYPPPPDSFDDGRQYIDLVTGEDELEDGFERSPDYMSSLNLLWVPEQELQQQSQDTHQEVDDEIGNTIDFYLEGLAGTASDLIWFLDLDESLKSATALEEQEDVEANDLPYDVGVAGDLQVDEDLSGSSAEHMFAYNEAEELFLAGTESSSRSSQAQEIDTSTTSWDEAEQLRANAQPEDLLCDCYRPWHPEGTGTTNTCEVQSLGLAQRRKSVEWSPKIASIYELRGRESNPAQDPHDNDTVTSRPAEKSQNVHHALGSEISEGPQMNVTSRERHSSPGLGSGKPGQINTSLSTEECVEDQGASTSDSLLVSSSVVHLTNGRAPTMSQFRDPSTSVRQTIFGLLVLAGGLYLVENRDEIEQQSISAAEAAAVACRWLGSFLIKMAKGEFDN